MCSKRKHFFHRFQNPDGEHANELIKDTVNEQMQNEDVGM